MHRLIPSATLFVGLVGCDAPGPAIHIKAAMPLDVRDHGVRNPLRTRP